MSQSVLVLRHIDVGPPCGQYPTSDALDGQTNPAPSVPLLHPGMHLSEGSCHPGSQGASAACSTVLQVTYLLVPVLEIGAQSNIATAEPSDEHPVSHKQSILSSVMVEIQA